MINKQITKIIFIGIAVFSQNTFAVGEKLYGSRTGISSSKTSACSSAKESAESAAQAQIAFLQGTGQLRDKGYQIKVRGCDCDGGGKGAFGVTEDFTCSAEWSINVM